MMRLAPRPAETAPGELDAAGRIEIALPPLAPAGGGKLQIAVLQPDGAAAAGTLTVFYPKPPTEPLYRAEFGAAHAGHPITVRLDPWPT